MTYYFAMCIEDVHSNHHILLSFYDPVIFLMVLPLLMFQLL